METKYSLGDIQNSLTELLEANGISLTAVSSDQNYWFIRTYGGDYFSDFRLNRFVGIGWDWEIDLDPGGTMAQALIDGGIWDKLSDGLYSEMIPHDEKSENRCLSKIRNTLGRKNKSKKQAQKDLRVIAEIPEKIIVYVRACLEHQSLSKIIRFEKNVQIDDIVIIPTYQGDDVMIGRITSEVKIPDKNFKIMRHINRDPRKKHLQYKLFPYARIRTVEWLHRYPLMRYSLNPKLTPMFCYQHGISDVTEKYSKYLEQTIFPIYKKNDYYHLTIPVIPQNAESSFDVCDFATVFNDFETLREAFSAKFNIDLRQSPPPKAGVNVQSEGAIFIASACLVTLLILGSYIVIGGGKLKFTSRPDRINAEISSKGLTDKILDFFEERNRQKLEFVKEAGRQQLDNRKMDLLEKMVDAGKVEASDLFNSLSLTRHPGVMLDSSTVKTLDEKNDDQESSENPADID